MSALLFDIQNIDLQLSKSEKPILSNITYQIQKEDFIIVLGSNGSGKTSLLKLLDQQYQPSSGNIFLNGKLLTDYSKIELSHSIKTLTQNVNESLFASLTIFENCLLTKKIHQSPLSYMKKSNERAFFKDYLAPFNMKLSSNLDQIVDSLSGGEKQSLALALKVLYPPRVLLLDEHTSALDPKSSEIIMALTQEIAKKYAITCLLTTHNLNIAKNYGNRILTLKNGKISQYIEAKEKEKLTSHDLLASCY